MAGGGTLGAQVLLVAAGRFFSITSRSPLAKWRSAPMVRKPCAVGQRGESIRSITEAKD